MNIVMTKSPSRKILLVGLPSTGKTSFLAALWYMVNQATIDCAFQLDRLDGDNTYLNMIRDSWLEYKPVPRNRLDSATVVSMNLKDRNTNNVLELSFPDLSGESFRLQWTARQFTPEHDELLRHVNGGILFVHPENIVAPLRIDTVNELAETLVDTVPAVESADGAGSQVSTKPWDIQKAPTQVQLVELLQFISGRDYFRPPFRLAIVVSAWDLVANLGEEPRGWISSQLPLLQQFIDCNEGVFEVAFYGVSAQGGRYVSAEAPELQKRSPGRRVAIVGPHIANPHDITEPLQWLMH